MWGPYHHMGANSPHRFRADSLDLPKLIGTRERSMLFASSDNTPGQFFADAWELSQFLPAGVIDVDDKLNGCRNDVIDLAPLSSHGKNTDS